MGGVWGRKLNRTAVAKDSSFTLITSGTALLRGQLLITDRQDTEGH